MTFHVGQKVVCVDDIRAPFGDWKLKPTKGTIYTISAVGLTHPNDPDKLPCVHVEEIDRPYGAPIWAHRFRPIVERKTDISIFKELLVPGAKIKEPA